MRSPQQPARELIGATGIFMVGGQRIGRLCRRGSVSMNAGPAHIGEGAAVTHQLLSGIRNMGAQSGQEVERREDPGGGGLGIAAWLALPAIVDDLTRFRAIAQALQGDRGMDHVAGQALARLMVVRIDALAVKDGEARVPPAVQDFHQTRRDLIPCQQGLYELVAEQLHDPDRIGARDGDKRALGRN
jgi:hypothetical protein